MHLPSESRYAAIILILIVTQASLVRTNLRHPQKFSLFPHSFSAEGPLGEANQRLYKNFIGDDGRVYACSGRNFFAFENNGSIAWAVHLNYRCHPNITPVHGGSRKIYLVAENRVLKIHPLKIGTSEPAVEVFFGQEQGTDGPGEIFGVTVSVSSSCVLINVKSRGLFAYKLHGQLMWSAGPVLYRHGYRQGCRKNITECYFTSAPVIDHCEASIYISNTVGELYSLSIRGPYFKWIQDLSSYGNTFTITPGHNGQVYATIPDKTSIVALDVSRGNILWEGRIGPLSSADYEPVVDTNGWISFGSMDGYLYSFSPTGDLRKYPKSAGLNSAIQVSPILDCSGYAVYISRTEFEGKISQTIGEYTYISAMKPRNVVFTLLNPASGSIYSSESDPGKLLIDLSRSDLQHFVMDERTLLAFFAASRNFNPLPCRTTRQKLSSSCSQVKPKDISVYTGNERTIVLFLLFETVLLVVLAALIRYCCIFWKKRKLQSLELGKFLEKRRSLRLQKKIFDRTITDLRQKASEEATTNNVLDKLSDLVKERAVIERKLSTTYSLGRDSESSRSKSLLPLFDGKTKSYSFQGSKRESVTLFHTVSDSTSAGNSSTEDDANENLLEDDAYSFEAKAKGKAPVEVQSSSDDEIRAEENKESPSSTRGIVNPLFMERSLSEINEVRMNDEKVVGNACSGSRSLRRRAMSFTD